MSGAADMSARSSARWFAWLLWLASIALAAWGLYAAVFLIPPVGAPLLFQVVFGFFMVLTPTIGLIVVTRQPANRCGWLFFAVGGGFIVNQAVHSYALVSVSLPDALPLAAAVAWTGVYGNVITLSGVAFLLLLFPDGRVRSRWRPLAWALGAAAAVMTVGLTFEPRLSADTFPNPLGVVIDPPVFSLMESIGRFGLLAGIALAAVSLGARYRGSRGIERLQIRWVASAAAACGVAIGLAPLLAFAGSDALNYWFFVLIIALSLIPIAAGVAILRYHLYDIDLVINRTLVYGTTSATLAAVFAGAQLVLQTALHPFTQGSDLAVAGSTLLIAALFVPLRARIRAAVDRRFYRSRYDAARTIDAFSARLRSEIELDAVRCGLLDAVHDTLQPAHASVWLRR